MQIFPLVPMQTPLLETNFCMQRVVVRRRRRRSSFVNFININYNRGGFWVGGKGLGKENDEIGWLRLGGILGMSLRFA